MKKKQQTMLIILAGLGAAVILYFILNTNSKNFSWREDLNSDSKEPYGTLFFRKLLESYRPTGKFILNKNKPVTAVFSDLPTRTDNAYVFIGQNLLLDSADTDSLCRFVARGNDAFIASLHVSDFLSRKFITSAGREGLIPGNKEKEEAQFSFMDSSLAAKKYQYRYRLADEDISYFWKFYNDSIFNKAPGFNMIQGHFFQQRAVRLGYVDEPACTNFMKITFGKGNFYFHAEPVVFTNYFMLQKDKVEYAATVLSYVKGKNIIWDEYSKLPWVDKKNPRESPMYFVLQQPSLKFAWWLILACVLLYCIVVAKRIQRVIPVLEPKKNSTLAFVNLVAALHFKNGNPLDMARKKMRYFLYFVKTRYGIQSQIFGDEQITRLSEKSTVSFSEIKVIFDQFNSIEKNAYYNTQTDKLVDLFNAIENFNNKCK